MDEITDTLSHLVNRQLKLNEKASPEARVQFELGHALGRLTMMKERDNWHYEATHDHLTGALNRRGFEERLDSAVVPKAILYSDVTNFKVVNDTLGEEMGDQVIRETFNALVTSVRKSDDITRWGGDEFLVILNGDIGPDVPPEHPMAYEYRQREKSPIDHIAEAKKNIAKKVQELLDKNPDLKRLGLDLAVGGVKWEGQPREVLISLAREDAKSHKKEQHEILGQYRKPATD